MEAGHTKSKIDLNWSLSALNNFICQSYPCVSLNLIGFELARTGKGRKIQKLQVSSVKELKKSIGKSRLYIVPRATVLQVCNYIGIYIFVFSHVSVYKSVVYEFYMASCLPTDNNTPCHTPTLIYTRLHSWRNR